MAGRRGVKTLKRSAIPGVTITQCVENIPEGCSTPDFERKPITVTLQEGKNAIFRAVVKGEPQPEVLWKRNSKEMDDPQKYQISFSPGANEFILQVNKITSEDADLYRCTAVNEYGEATCTAGLKIIQVGFKKKPKEIPSVPQADLKKEIQDFRKTLKKRAPSTTPKKEIDMEQVWQLLLNADRKDYEKICLKYGIVDFRGMLRRLQEMKKEREDEQAQYVLTLTNLRHVRVNEDQGNASFDLEMELKHPESRIYLYKDGQVINFGFDSDNVKHCLQNIGKKYNFIINDLQPEDAGMYQIKVEDVDIFSTELEAESIPVSFRYPLGEVRCHEQGNAAFQCTLYEACFDSVWLHKTHHLEANDKYDILVSDDGLIHRLVIKNAQASDKGTYTIDIGSRSSSAWLEVESKGKRKQIEGNSDDKTGWQNKQLDEDHAKKLHQGKGHDDQDGQYRNGQDANGESYGSLGKDGSLGRGRADRDGKMGQFSGVGIDMAEGNQFSGFAGSSMGLAMLTGNAVSEGMGNLAGIGSLYGKDSMSDGTGAGTRSGGAGGLQTSDSSTLNGAGPSDRFSRAHSMGSQDSMLGSADVASDRCGVGGVDGAGAGLGVPGKAEGFYGKKGGLRSAGGVGARLDSAGGLSSKDDGLDGAGGPGAGFGGGPAGGLYSKDGMLERVGMSSAGGRGGVGEDGKLDGVGIIGAGARGEGRIYGSANSHGAGLDGIVGLYGKDGRAGADGPGGAVGVGEHYGKDGMPGGAGSGGPGGVGGLYGKDDVLPRSGTGASGGFYGKDGMGPGSAGGLYGKDGMTTEAGIGAPGGAGGTDGLYDKDMLDGGGASAGGPGGAGGIGGFYDQDGMLGGAGPSAAGGIGGLHGKDGIPFGGGANGPSAAGGAGGLYGKDGMQAGTGGAMGVGGLYGKDGMLGSARAGGAGGNGGLCGKNAMLCGAGPGGPGGAGGFGGLYGKDGMLVSGTTSGPGGAVGISGLYSKEGLPVGGGTGEPSDTGGVGGLYGKNGMLSGAGAGGLGGTGGIGGLYGKDGMPVSGGTGGPGSTGDIGGLYGKDDLPVSRGNDGPGDARGVGGLYGKDGMLAGAGAAGGGLYGKDGLSVGGDIGGPGGAGGTGGLYDKDGMLAGAGGLSGAGGVWGLYGKYGMVGGAGAGGPGSTGVIGRLYGKDGMPVNGSTNGSSSTGDIGGLYGKDGLPVGKGNGGPGGAGEVGGLYGKDGLPVGRGNGGPGGAGEVGGLYGKAYMIDGAEVGGAGRVGGYYGKDGILDGDGDGGPGSADRVGGLHGKDGVLGGAGAGRPGDAAGVAGLYGQDITLGGAGLRGATDTGGLYGRDGMPGGPGAGGARGVGGLYSKDAMLAAGGSGSAGGIGGLYDKDGMPGGTGTAGTWGTGALCGKDCILGGAGGTGSAGGIDGFCCKDGMPGGTGVGGAGGMCGTHGKNSLLVGAGAELRSTGGRGGLHGQDSILGGAGLGNGGSTGENSGKAPMYEGDSIPGYGLDGTGAASDMQGGAGSAGLSSAENMRGHHGKEGVFPGAGGAGLTGLGGTGDLYDQACTLHGSSAGSASAPLGGVGKTQELHSQGIMMDGTGGDGTKDDVRGAGYDEGGTGSLCGKDCRLCGTGAGGLSGEGWLGNLCDRDIRLGGVGVGPGNRGVDGSQYEKMSNIPGEEFLGYGQSSGLFDAGTHAGNRRRQLSNLDASGHPSSDISRTKDRKGRGGSLLEGDVREPHCCFNQGLFDLHALKGKPAALTCSLNNDKLEGTWFKDGFKIIGLDGVSIEKDGPVHKLIIDEVQDSHAGKYQFEAEGVRTEASIFAEDPPNVDSALLEKLQKEPIVVKAGKNAIVKIPFEGRKPIRATWLKDEDELLDDARISIDYSDNFTRLSISSTHRMDCGEYKVKLKNKCGSAEATFKLVVTAKPQPPMGPVEVMDSSRSGITIQWKPPKDDGGKPVQSYIIEKQQVGRTTWVTLGRTGGSSTIFTTNKVEADKSYYFKVKAVNTEGTSEALESDEVMAATKAFPGRPAPPKIVSANKDAITLSWTAPHKIGNSQILGYSVEKCKKGSNTWTPITDLPIPDRKYTVTDLKEGLLYEFRVAAINTTGVGEVSAPSEAVFARDPMKPPGPVRDLKVVSTDYCSISLSWMKPEAEEESHAKGYVIEMRHTDTLKWTQYNALPIPKTTYTVRGLKAREMYFLRVRAINNGGFGEHVELDTCVQAVPATVHPKLLVKDIIKSFMIVKAGNTIRLRIPFEAFPTPEVLWLKDGLSLPAKATIATREGLSQLIIPGANFSDSGHYAIILQTEGGNKETFSILVQVLDIPESPGPIQLIEKVPDTVTLMWEPSPTEKREGNLNYMVMRRDSNKGLWELVADLIYTNKYTVSNFVPGREYFFRVLAKNCMGISEPSETVQPWSIHRDKGKFEVSLPKYKGINETQPPRFLVPLKPHVVTLGFDCHMSCAVTGYPVPQVTWYKDGKNLSQDPTFFCKNDFGVCSLVILGVTPTDGGQYEVVAINELGQAVSKAEVTIKGSMHDGLADGYSYGTARGSYYAKAHTGNNWGHAMYNGTLKREAENKRYSSYSQMDGWGGRNYNKICSPTSPGSDYCFVQNMKSSRSEPDLCCDVPRGTLRRNQSGSRVSHKTSLYRHSHYDNRCNNQNDMTTSRTSKRVPVRSPSCTSANKQDVVYAQPVASSKQDVIYGQAHSNSKICNDEMDYGAMTIQKAIQLLCSSDEKYQAMGAYYLQHTCFQDESAKQEVYRLGGIAKLVELLRSLDENVQQASAGALRNLVFRNPTNKLETRRQNGIRESVNLLRRTGSTEIQKQLTGLLWNLSSTDELKEDLIHDALPVLTDRVIIPFSGWSDGVSNRSKEIVDPEVFFNATGCLRNLSSADAGRQTMRSYPGLIDSVMTYSQNCVAANRPDDKSVENCICILHNLSYRLDAEVPNKYTQLNHMARSTYTDKTLTGCFNNRGGKLEYDEYDLPLPEEDYKPKGSSWLYHSDAIRTYLSLMDQSKKDATLEACAGALQNLTASRGLMSNGMSQLIALKEKGLPRIARLLQSTSAEVVRSGTSLLSNMSRHPILHKTMAHQVLPDVTRLLALQAPGSSNYGDIMTSACYTLRNLIMSNPQMAKPYLTGSLINNVVGLCRNGSYPKAAEAGRMLLSDLWSNRELQTILKQQGYDKNMMGSLTGSTFRTLSSRF